MKVFQSARSAAICIYLMVSFYISIITLDRLERYMHILAMQSYRWLHFSNNVPNDVHSIAKQMVCQHFSQKREQIRDKIKQMHLKRIALEP